MNPGSVAALNVAGLVLSVAASLLLAFDLWTPRHPELQAPHDMRMLVIDLIEGALSQPTDHGSKLKRLHESASALALHETASRSAATRTVAHARSAGRLGLVLLALGFIAQLAGAIGSMGGQ